MDGSLNVNTSIKEVMETTTESEENATINMNDIVEPVACVAVNVNDVAFVIDATCLTKPFTLI